MMKFNVSMNGVEERTKHLEFIQGVINRMAQNSFLLKGWGVTLVSALFALAAKDANIKYVIVAYIPVVAFWLLDAYYLYQERLYRALYESVRKNETTDFDLNASKLKGGRNTWSSTFLSKTIIIFYGALIATMLVVMYFIK